MQCRFHFDEILIGIDSKWTHGFLFPGGEGSSHGDVSSPRAGSSQVRLRKRKLFAAGAAGVELEDIAIESDYKGPHIKFPITLQNLQELIDGFKKKKVIKLVSSRYAWRKILYKQEALS